MDNHGRSLPRQGVKSRNNRNDLIDKVVPSQTLGLMILEIFPSLNNSMILLYSVIFDIKPVPHKSLKSCKELRQA